MCATDLIGVGRVDEEHARANDVVERSAGFLEGQPDDLEAARGLGVRILVDVAVGPDGRRARNQDSISDAERAAEPDAFFERRPGADPPPGVANAVQGFRKGSSSSCSNLSWTAVRSSPASAFSLSWEPESEMLTTLMWRSAVCSA